MEFFLKKLDSNNLISSNYEYRNFFSLPKVKAKTQSNSFIKNTAEKSQNLLMSFVGPFKALGSMLSSTDPEFNEYIKLIEIGRGENKELLVRVIKIIENMEEIRNMAEAKVKNPDLDLRELRTTILAEDLLIFETKKNALENLTRNFFENVLENTLFFIEEIKRDLENVIEKQNEYLIKTKTVDSRNSGSENWKYIQASGLKSECEVLLSEISVFVKGLIDNLENSVFEFRDAYLGIELWGFFKNIN